jgi:hypothetical protein
MREHPDRRKNTTRGIADIASASLITTPPPQITPKSSILSRSHSRKTPPSARILEPEENHLTRAEINRLNAQKSTGPCTPEGKQKSSLNALRHGLTSQIAVIPGEDPELYQIHLQAFLDEYDPQSVSELHLVRSLADLAWRIDRIASLEANLLLIPGGTEDIQDTVTLVKTRDVLMRAVSNLSLHGHRLSRQLGKTRADLLEIQKQNKGKTTPGFVFTDLADETAQTPNRDREEADSRIDSI